MADIARSLYRLYVCTFLKERSKKEHHVVSRGRILGLEATEVSHASSHYVFGRALAPLYLTVSGASLEAPIPVLRDCTAGAESGSRGSAPWRATAVAEQWLRHFRETKQPQVAAELQRQRQGQPKRRGRGIPPVVTG
jgi:hypothetical protein